MKGTYKYDDIQTKENKSKMKLLVFCWFIILLFYAGLLIIEALFYGGDMRVALLSMLAGSPLLAFAFFIYFRFPNMIKASLFIAVGTQLTFISVGTYLRELDYYFFVIFLVLGAVMIMKNFKVLAMSVAIIFIINIAVIIFLIPNLEWVNHYRFFMQFMLFLAGSVFFLIQTYNVERKETDAWRALLAFSSLLRSTPNYMVITDSYTRVRYISEPMANFAYFSSQELAVGKPLLDLFSDKKLKLMFADVLDADGFIETVTTIEMDGESRHFNVVADKLVGDVEGMFIDISDITDMVKSWKAAEEAQAKAELANTAKSQFLATMSHEIRTPMNAITGMSELLLRRNIPNDARADAQDIKQAAANLLSIINDILDLSKIEAGKLEVVPVRYMLSSLINDVVNIIRMRLMEKPIRFYTNIDGNIPNNLIGDEVRLRQIILNLLSNAAKFTEKGYISMSITMDKRTDEKVFLKIVISDTGFGIKPEDQAKLFTDFGQIDTKKTRGIEGTGLGLAITKRLCVAMDGDISAISEYGKGSEFTVIFPQGVDSELLFATVEEPNNKKVLVYEGRNVYAESVCWSLKNLGVPHTMVTNHKDFVEALGREEWFYVFSGYGLYDKIKTQMENTTFPGGKKPSLALMVEWGTEAYISNVRFVSLPIQSLSIANTLNGKDDRRDFFSSSASGSLFRFTIPKARLLVVDDIATNLKVIEGLLAPYQAMVDTCLSGAEAIELVKRHDNYDIVFMDHMMPEMDGIEATTAIRALDGNRFKTMPIVALTANAVSGMREVFLEKGFSDFLAKPIDVSKLDEILDCWIPKEKIVKRMANDEPAMSNDNTLVTAHSLLSNIPGIDVQQGITMTGGTTEGYRAVLSLFCKDVENRLPLLQTIPDAETLTMFITQVHAMKSAAASIGAEEVSQKAAELEAAGQTGDFAFIEENLGGFVESLTELAGALRATPLHATPRQTTATPIPVSLLSELGEALKLQKASDIDRILGELMQKAPDTKTKEILEQISDNVLMAEYAGALKIVERLKG